MAQPQRLVLKPGFRLGASFKARFNDQGDRMVTLGKRITLWDVADRARIARGPALSNASEVDFAHDGSRVVAKNTSGEVVVIDAETFEERVRFPGSGRGEGSEIRFSPCGRYLVDGSWGGVLLVRDAESGEVIWQELEAGTAIFNLQCTRDRAFWAYDRHDRSQHWFLARAWPFWDHEPIRINGIERGSAFALRDDRRLLAVTTQNLQLWQLDGADATLRIERPIDGGRPDVLCWSPDGQALAHAANKAGHVYSADLDSLCSVALQYPSDAEFSPRGDLVAFGDWSQGIAIAWPPEPPAD
jgi:WD40 repeat protein